MSIKNQGIADIIGRPFTAEMDTQVSEFIGKNYVPKTDFNTRKTQLDEAIQERDTIKQERDDALNKLNEYSGFESRVQQYEKAIVETHLTDAFKDAGVRSQKALETAMKMVDYGKIKLDDDLKPEGFKEQVEEIAKTETYLFGKSESSAAGGSSHAAGGEAPPTHTTSVSGGDSDAAEAANWMKQALSSAANIDLEGDD